MMQIFNKYFHKAVGVLSFVVLVDNIVRIIHGENNIGINVLYTISIIEIPICICLITLLVANKRKSVIIEGINLVTLDHELNNHKDLLRKTKYFEIQSVDYIYEFKDKNFTSIRAYKGKCISKKNDVTTFPLVVAGDNNVSFSDINCHAYDLIKDYNKINKRCPSITDEGIYKIANYNFDSPLKNNDKFHIETHYTWPNCVSPKKDYILASPIFYKKSFDRFNVELRFFDKVPIRIKRYIVNQYKIPSFQGELTRDAVQKDNNYISFTDTDIEMKSIVDFYVYVYYFED